MRIAEWELRVPTRWSLLTSRASGASSPIADSRAQIALDNTPLTSKEV